MSDLSPNDLSIMEKLKEASQKSISEFLKVYPIVQKFDKPNGDGYPWSTLWKNAIDNKRYDEAKLLLKVFLDNNSRAIESMNDLQLSNLCSLAVHLAIRKNDDEIFEWSQNYLKPKKDESRDLPFNTACYHAVKGDKKRMLEAIARLFENWNCKPSEFLKDTDFKDYKKDPDFLEAIKGKKKIEAGKDLIVWKTKPTEKQVLSAIQQFFETLFKGKMEDAQAMVKYKYKWNDVMASLYLDICAYGYDETLDEKAQWNKDVSWLNKVGIENELGIAGSGNVFDADETPDCVVTITYEKEATDISADFSVKNSNVGYYIELKNIHVV